GVVRLPGGAAEALGPTRRLAFVCAGEEASDCKARLRERRVARRALQRPFFPRLPVSREVRAEEVLDPRRAGRLLVAVVHEADEVRRADHVEVQDGPEMGEVAP